MGGRMLRLILTCCVLCICVAWAFAQPAVSPFHISYVAGVRDAAGRFMGGTELMNFAVHDGRLYAGVGYWEDRPGIDPRSGAQVVVRDGPSAPWHSDHVFPGTLRLDALRSVTFTTDGQGHAIPPTSVLLATPDDLVHGTASVWSRDDATGTWTEMVLAHPGALTDVRALGFHHDAITGVDYVFAGANTNARWLDRGWTYRIIPQENTGIFLGVYDPAVPGRIRWKVVPEFTHYVGRPMAFAEANGVLYVVIRGTMYRRVDGPTPTWVKVFSWPRPIVPKNSGLRGLVAIPNPSGRGESLLVALEGVAGRVFRIDPMAGYRAVVELDVEALLRQQWGLARDQYVIIAYNDMSMTTDPRTQEPELVLGLQAHDPAPGRSDSAWYLIRHADARYELREVHPIPDPHRSTAALVAVRAIQVSPFPADGGQVVYLGGYDCNFTPAHNTAWMYQVELSNLVGPAAPAPR